MRYSPFRLRRLNYGLEEIKSCLDSGQTLLHALELDGKISVVACVFKNVYAVLDRNNAVTDNGASEVVSARGSEEADGTVN